MTEEKKGPVELGPYAKTIWDQTLAGFFCGGMPFNKDVWFFIPRWHGIYEYIEHYSVNHVMTIGKLKLEWKETAEKAISAHIIT